MSRAPRALGPPRRGSLPCSLRRRGPAAQPTTVQPAVQPATARPAVQPTTVRPAVQPATARPAVQPTTVQPAVQPGSVQPTTVQPAVQPAPHGPDANGTQVLFLGDEAWTTPGAPGKPGEGGDRYGYHRAQRRRRMWLMGGLAGGTAVALGLIALVVTNLGNSHPAPAVSKTPVKSAVTTRPPSPSPTPSQTQPATPLTLTDGTSGLSYPELPSPRWQLGCPSALSQSFSWSDGESAIAAQVNGGQTTWYGEACSAPLPQQYGYNGVSDLQNVTTNLVNQFTGAYYNGLPHGYQQEQNQPITVSGHAGWEIKYLITYQNPQGQLPFSDEEGVVVVADLGTGAAPAVFFASVPGNLTSGGGTVDSLVSSLQLTAPIQPGGGGSPGDGSPAPGSPGDGGGSPGDGGAGGGGNGGGGQGD